MHYCSRMWNLPFMQNGRLMMSIATKTGDNGFTGIIGGKRLPKDHPILECLGTIDELDAFLGDAKAALNSIGSQEGSSAHKIGDSSAGIIDGIQKDLIKLMGIIAGMPVTESDINQNRMDSLVKELESQLPPLTSFAVPGVNPVSAKLHIARTVCRRTERQLVGLNLDADTGASVVPYINRLSDLLFLLAQKESISNAKETY